MFDFSYSNILHSNLINFILMVGLLAVVFAFLNVPKKLQDEAKNVRNDIDESREIKEKSEFILKKAKEKYKNLDIEVKKITDEANKISDNFMSKAVSDADDIIKNIKQDYEKIFEREIFKIKKGVTFDISDKSLKKSTEKLKEMFKNQELQEKYIDASIKKLGEIEL